MSSLVRGARGLVTAAAAGLSKKTYQGCLFAALNNRGEVVYRHPMDTNVDEYWRVVNEIVIPKCMEIAPEFKGYSDRVKHLLQYANPSFSDVWNFVPELSFRICAPENQQTEENLTRIRILRAILDLSWTMTAVLDDIVDGSDMRMKKAAWYTFCEGSTPAAQYDGTILCFLPIYILLEEYRGAPGYNIVLDMLLQGMLTLLIGEHIDVMGFKDKQSEQWQKLTMLYKAGHFVSSSHPIGLLHAGIHDKDILSRARYFTNRAAQMFQVWDDFNDYYSNTEATGKPCRDLMNAGTTWASVTACKHFTPAQLKLFKECYGDPDKAYTVLQLYEEVNLTNLYVEHMRKQYREMAEFIAQIPHEKVREALTSHLDWFIGDVKE